MICFFLHVPTRIKMLGVGSRFISPCVFKTYRRLLVNNKQLLVNKRLLTNNKPQPYVSSDVTHIKKMREIHIRSDNCFIGCISFLCLGLIFQSIPCLILSAVQGHFVRVFDGLEEEHKNHENYLEKNYVKNNKIQ